jgi:quinol-cytochrome oxidoreductase complex cytochrome b subunit
MTAPEVKSSVVGEEPTGKEPTGKGPENSFPRWLSSVTDASILVIPRFFGLVYGHIDDRLGLGDALRAAMGRRLPGHVGWKHAFGGATYFLFMILVATGVMLSFYYRPSAVEAYPSLQYLETEVGFGWLVRHIHYWAASLVVVAVLIHLYRILVTGAYRTPRETTWLMGIFLLLTLLAFVTSGYLLPWDQEAYWITTDGLDQLARLPLVGGFIAQLFRADEFVSGATLSRFYAVHVILLPWVALLLLALHFQLVRKHGVAGWGGVEAGEGMPFFPHHMLRQLVVVLLVVGMVVTFASFWPRPFGEPANPFTAPSEIQPHGIPATILVGAGRLPGGLGLVALPVLLLLLAVLPLIDRQEDSPSRRRRYFAVLISMLFLGLLIGSWVAGLGVGGGVSGGGG